MSFPEIGPYIRFNQYQYIHSSCTLLFDAWLEAQRMNVSPYTGSDFYWQPSYMPRDSSSVQLNPSLKMVFIFFVYCVVGAIINKLIATYWEEPYAQHEMNEERGRLISQEELNENEMRLKQAGYEGNIPHEFRDPVWMTVMHIPVITVGSEPTIDEQQTSMDISTAKQLLRMPTPLHPISRVPFTHYIVNVSLRNAIESWINYIEKEAKAKPLHEQPREMAKLSLSAAQCLFNVKIPKVTDQIGRECVRQRSLSFG